MVKLFCDGYLVDVLARKALIKWGRRLKGESDLLRPQRPPFPIAAGASPVFPELSDGEKQGML
jgi:hypothetical protein